MTEESECNKTFNELTFARMAIRLMQKAWESFKKTLSQRSFTVGVQRHMRFSLAVIQFDCYRSS